MEVSSAAMLTAGISWLADYPVSVSGSFAVGGRRSFGDDEEGKCGELSYEIDTAIDRNTRLTYRLPE